MAEQRTGTQDRKERGFYIANRGEATVTRIGEGIESLDEQLNPQSTTTNYINGKTSNTLTSYQESWPISGHRYVGDPANDLFAEKAEMRAKGPDAQMDLVVVNFFEEDEDDPGSYRAFHQPVSYSPESGGGGAATDPLGISGTLNADGEVTEGLFTPASADDRDSGTFVASTATP